MTGARVLDRYDAAALLQMFEQAGIIDALRRKGFTNVELIVDAAGRALPHALVFARKRGRRFQLLDACIGEAVVRPDFFRRRDYPMERAVELAAVHWVREEDPTALFVPSRPALPLQEHPGLGVLRLAFHVLAQAAAAIDKDGVINMPKFFHDAVIFFHSRLFLFLDADEQGRFEALLRDLAHLRLGDASLALASGAVRDAHGAVTLWQPGYLVFPLSEALTAYLHSPQYATRVSAALNDLRFTVDAAAFAAGRYAAHAGAQ